MAFLKFSRDKRGYEYFSLVQPSNRRGKSSRPRLLYWFRTPPNLKVGRPPFDDQARRALEAVYPGISFDWPQILETPIPPPENESWRERRRERAARQAAETEPDVEEGGLEPAPAPERAREQLEVEAEPIEAQVPRPSGEEAPASNTAAAEAAVPDSGARRRRRRGGRGRHRPGGGSAPSGPSDGA